MRIAAPNDLAEWRRVARQFLGEGVTPKDILWQEEGHSFLFETTEAALPGTGAMNVPRSFLTLAEKIACHRDRERWALLYEALWRLTQGEPHLFKLVTDPLVRRLDAMEQAIRRDSHKTKAFVRFRLCHDDAGDIYIAWHRPDHRILPITAPFFARRFPTMRWTILTPDQSAHWDLTELHYGAGVPQSAAPSEDKLEEVWKAYYRATFNPARINTRAMIREMPVRHWRTLPEAAIIPSLLQEAPERVERMLRHQEGSNISAADFLPPDEHDLAALREASKGCEGCELYRHATQTVFGEGPAKARLILVGEQPGDQEDRSGQPFVGPAGRLLDKVMQEAKIDRDQVYITNAVKHFKFVLKGERRMHQSPTVRETGACKPWLEKEIAAIKPDAILCLGATAAKSVIHRGFTLKAGRGEFQQSALAPGVMASFHPAAILRMPDHATREVMTQQLTDDLSKIWLFIRSRAGTHG